MGGGSNSICRHHIVKPFADGEEMLQSSEKGHSRPADEMEYCTHPYSPHLPGTPGGVTCGGDATKCGIPKAKR